MNVRNFATLLGFVLALSAPLGAQANLITDSHILTASGAGSVIYTHFSLDHASLTQIYTMGPTIDPVLYLFRDDGHLSGDNLLASNDDGCPYSLCGPAGAYSNSLITTNLNAAAYLVAVSDHSFSLDEAMSGRNANDRTGPVSVVIKATHARVALRGAEVPEPGSLALASLGLAGLLGLRRPVIPARP